jgi:transglutaminase-like putative cysteine protease
MQIRLGYEIVYNCPQPVPMLMMVNVHPSLAGNLLQPDILKTEPYTWVRLYHDSFGNLCSRLVAPAGITTFSADAIIHDDGLRDALAPPSRQLQVDELPDEVLVFLLASRYCETEPLMQTAWQLFGNGPEGAARVQNICNFVNGHIGFDYAFADIGRTAARGFAERRGVCRDFAHLAITFCRCMNIPARYCTGYLGDIGVPAMDAPMDFAAWFEAYLDGNWYTFDPRNNQSMPRLGRVLMARGRDAADVAIATTFGVANLQSFRVWTDQIA